MKEIIVIAAKKEILLTFDYKTFFMLNSTGHFVCFVASRPKSTAMVMAGRSVHPTFSWPSLNKQLTSTSCIYLYTFACN